MMLEGCKNHQPHGLAADYKSASRTNVSLQPWPRPLSVWFLSRKNSNLPYCGTNGRLFNMLYTVKYFKLLKSIITFYESIPVLQETFSEICVYFKCFQTRINKYLKPDVCLLDTEVKSRRWSQCHRSMLAVVQSLPTRYDKTSQQL